MLKSGLYNEERPPVSVIFYKK